MTVTAGLMRASPFARRALYPVQPGLPAIREGQAQPEPDEDAPRQPAQGVRAAGPAPQPASESSREEAEYAEARPSQQREGQPGRQQLKGSAAWAGRIGKPRQEDQEEQRHLRVEHVRGHALNKDAPNKDAPKTHVRRSARYSEALPVQKRSDSQI